MNRNLLYPFFYIGLVFVTVGTLFKIQHWAYGGTIQTIGVVLELVFFTLVLAEIVRSRKASLSVKTTFALLYTVLPVVAILYLPALILIFALLVMGTVYFRSIRKKFLYRRAAPIANNFGHM